MSARACRTCWRSCGGFWADACTERVLSPLLVLLVHASLVFDVFFHRPDLLEAGNWWAGVLWTLVACTILCYLRAAFADPGWLLPAGMPAPAATSRWRACLLCLCAALALASEWRSRTQPGRSPCIGEAGPAELGGLTDLSEEDPQATHIGRILAHLGGDEEEGTSPRMPSDVGGIQKRRAGDPFGALGGSPRAGAEGAEAAAPARQQPGLELRWCKRCLLYQPLRSKHCSDCQRCVRTHDHHCPWIGSCVGENNRVIFFWFLVLQTVELAVFFREGCQGISVSEPSVALVVGLLFIAVFFFMVSCLLTFHTFLVLSNLTTWEHISWRRITYLRGLQEEKGSPFSRSHLGNVAAYCCTPAWCPVALRRLATLRYDDHGGVLWELSEPRAPCCLVRMCGDCC